MNLEVGKHIEIKTKSCQLKKEASEVNRKFKESACKPTEITD